MSRVMLLDYDGKLPNIALMRLSTYHKQAGDEVFLNHCSKPDIVYVSTLFTWNKGQMEKVRLLYPDAIIGGTGWDLTTTLPPEIDACRPDYDLYSVQDIYGRIKGGIRKKDTTIKKAQTIVDAGLGFLSRGCQRSCPFCIVRKKEGPLHHVATIDEILNPRSNVLILMDNNLLANPNCIDILREIRERNLVVDISQGIDCRLVTDEISQELSKIKHLRHLHMAWDLMSFEHQVMRGIHHLKNWI